MGFKLDIGSVKFLTMEKFPRLGYTMKKITNEYRSSFYSTGGVVFSTQALT
jgi:hypothetical protein